MSSGDSALESTLLLKGNPTLIKLPDEHLVVLLVYGS